MALCHLAIIGAPVLMNMEIIKFSLAEKKCGLWGCTQEQSDPAQKSSPVSTMRGMSKGNPTTVDQKSKPSVAMKLFSIKTLPSNFIYPTAKNYMPTIGAKVCYASLDGGQKAIPEL